MTFARAALGAGLAFVAVPAMAQSGSPVTATSPDGKVRVTLAIDGDGRAVYAWQ